MQASTLLTRLSTAALRGIGAPISATTGDLATWQKVEGGWTNDPGMYNPWNTTFLMGKSHGTNEVGVESYPDFASGVAASISMIGQSNMSAIRAALLSSAPIDAFEAAVHSGP